MSMDLLIFCLLAVAGYQYLQASAQESCNINWQLQPLQEVLPCDPLGADITLECASDPVTLTVSWFWTQDVSQAGTNGTQILLGASLYTVTNIVPGFQRLFFQVNEFTVGYYWCEIIDADVATRPSGIASVTSNCSLPPCLDPYESLPHNVHLECAIDLVNDNSTNTNFQMTKLPTVSQELCPSPTANTFTTVMAKLPSTTQLMPHQESSTMITSKSIPQGLHSESLLVHESTIWSIQAEYTMTPCSCDPLTASNSLLPWIVAAGLGAMLLFVLILLFVSILIYCRLKRKVTLLKEKIQGEEPVTNKRSKDGCSLSATSPIAHMSDNDVKTCDNVAYAAVGIPPKGFEPNYMLPMDGIPHYNDYQNWHQ